MESIKKYFIRIKTDFTKLYFKIKNWNKTYKIITLVVLAVVLADSFLINFVLVNQKKAKIKFSAFGVEEKSSLVALDSGAHKGKIKSNGKQSPFASFGFTSSQKKQIAQFFEDNKTAAVAVRVEITPNNSQFAAIGNGMPLSFKMGFLSEDNFSEKSGGKKKFVPFKMYDFDKAVVSADYNKIFRDNLPENKTLKFDLSIAIPKKAFESSLPEGFFIYSDFDLKITSFCIVPVQIGFDKSGVYPFFGFGANGGIIDSSNSSVDFSAASAVFSVQNSPENLLPEIVITLSKDESQKASLEKSVSAKLNAGGEQIFIKNSKKASELIIPAASIKNPYILIDIAENKECIQGMILRTQTSVHKTLFENTTEAVYNPIRTDPGMIVKYPKNKWRVKEYELFEWDRYPGILFFDTENYDVQGKFFSRLAYFVEKEGFKGTILTNAQLNGKHGYNAHDYSAESLASFFNAVDKSGVEINKEEEFLRKILLQNEIIFESENGYIGGKGGLVSISQESELYLRNQLLVHEGYHTLFFTDEEFRNFVAAVYYTMDEKTNSFLIDYFKSQSSLGYDTNDDYLMHNEFMAYVLQNALRNVSSYFVTRAKWASVKKYTPELAAYIVESNGQGFEDAAIMLNDFIFDKYGLISGSVSLVNR
ncbi:MAG: hypothetical protein MJ188_04065 [Treponema sp.]|nr:hypothetical protein [Treponema sp.]